MSKNIWIIGLVILVVIIIFGIYMNRRIEKDPSLQGGEIIEELSTPVHEYEEPWKKAEKDTVCM